MQTFFQFTMNRMTIFVLVILVIHIHLTQSFGRRQRFIVKGKLICGQNPEPNVLVKLLDEDDGGIDDKMAEIRTNRDGEFYLDGEESEMTPIDPKLEIYHDCNDALPCQRKWIIKLPDKYINTNEAMDIGVLNLQVIQHSEKRDCFFR